MAIEQERQITDESSQDAGIANIKRLARELDPEPEHAFQVRRTAEALFDLSAGLHGLGPSERRILTAAALLHDTGYAVAATAHHKHSRDIILQQEAPGFDEREWRMVACVARYHRKAHPRPSHKLYCALSAGDQLVVSKLAAILRVADGLDRTHTASARSIRFEVKNRVARLYVRQRRPNPTDIWAGMRKRGLFEYVFGVALEIVSGDGP